MMPGAAHADPVTLMCGDVVTQDVVLAADVTCDLFGSTPALVVGADDITIDLNGHRVAGPNSVHVGFPGIQNDGHNGVTIRNGSAGGTTGIVLIGASNNRLIGIGAGGDFGSPSRVAVATRSAADPPGAARRSTSRAHPGR